VERGGLTPDGLCVAENFHLVQEALQSRCRVAAIVSSESAAVDAERIARGVEVIPVRDSVFRAIAGTETPQGVLALVEPPEHSVDDVFLEPALTVVIDSIQDPGNAGAILRAAEAFGATGVVLVKGSVNPYNPKAVRASSGSVFRVPLITGLTAEQVLEEMRQRHIEVYAAMPRAATPLGAADLTVPCAIVLGSEGHGIGRVLAHAAKGVRIPTHSVESLNAAVAAGVLLYEAARQRSA
jgi:TrmH family RNA methyltransferase